jgi:hypothetical protein
VQCQALDSQSSQNNVCPKVRPLNGRKEAQKAQKEDLRRKQDHFELMDAGLLTMRI